MKTRQGFFILFVLVWSISIGAQNTDKIKVGKETFVNPTIKTLGYLMSNVDTAVWKNVFIPTGYVEIPLEKRITNMEYEKKTSTGYSYFISFDAQYWVLTIIWKDENGKNFITADLKKELKGKQTGTGNQYKVSYNNVNYIIGLGSVKDKKINEMITVEIERP